MTSSAFALLPAVESGAGLMEALDQIEENFRPVKVNQFRRALCLDRETRNFYVDNAYQELIVLADKFPHAMLLAFVRRNKL
jgi:hypothetical protein